MLKKLLGQSTQYLFGGLTIKMVSFVSLPLLTRLLSVEEYGLFSLVGASLFLLSAFSKFGLHHATVRFYSESRHSAKQLATFYSTLFWGSLTIALIVAAFLVLLCRILGYYFGGIYNDWLVLAVMGLVVIDVMLIRVISFLQVEQKIRQFNLISIFHRLGSLLLGIFFLFFIYRSANWYFLGSLIAGFTILIVSLFVCVDKNKINPRDFSLGFLKESLRFGVPLQIMEFGNLFIKFSDKYFLQFIVGMSTVGIYAVGAGLTMYVQDLIFLPIKNAIFPLLMDLHKKKGRAVTEEFLSDVTSYLWVVAIPIVFGFSMLKEDIILIMASEKFIKTTSIIPLMITGAILWGFCQLYAAGLHISKRTKKYAFIVFVGVLINLGLNSILIPLLSFKGAAIATVITYTFLLFLIAKVSFVYLRVKINPGRITKAMLASACMSLVVYSIHIDPLIIQLIVKIIIGTTVFFVCMIAIDSQVRNIVLKLCKLYFMPSLAFFTNGGLRKRS